MSRELTKMNLIAIVQQLPKDDIEVIQTYISMIEQENSQLKEMVNHEHKYGSEMEGKYILEREKNKKAIKYLKYLKDSTAKYSLNTWNLRKLIKILEGKNE